MLAVICKAAAIILAIGDVIYAFKSGYSYGKAFQATADIFRYSDKVAPATRSFSFSAFFSVLLLGAVVCLILYVLGEVLSRLENIEGSLYTTNTVLKSSRTNKRDPEKTWICPNCDTVNDSLSLACKNCGQYKK